MLGRTPNAIVFDPAQSGRAVAATSGAGAAFVARFDSGGTLRAATYLGGQGGASINGVATDSAGNIYVAGTTNSFDFPFTPGTLQPAPPNGNRNFFAAKLDTNLHLVYSTYLRGFSAVTGIAVDPSGRAVIAGMAAPGGAGAGPPLQCFATKLAPDAGSIVFSTIFGGTSGDTCSAVAADSAANTILAGQTSSPDYPRVGLGTQTKRQGYTNAVLTKLDPAGNLVYSGYLGGGDRDSASAVAVDAAGNIYVAGTTSSKDFPVTNGAYQTALASDCAYPSSVVVTGLIGTIFSYHTDDAFVTKFDPNGNLIFST